MRRRREIRIRRREFLRQYPVWVFILLAVLALILLSTAVYNIPAVNERLSWRIDELRTNIRYALNPPEEAIFVPEEQGKLDDQIAAIVSATLAVLSPNSTSTPSPTATTEPGVPTNTPEPTPIPTITPTPLPDEVFLDGVKYEDQHNRWNYCGPANLSMNLTFWGWEGNRDIVGAYVKPETWDKNVMPYEMEDFVETQTEGLGALVRYGGEIELIKRFLASGFPVLTEKGYYEYDYTGKLGWLGHYQFITGYDEDQDILIVQDTYIDDGQNHRMDYDEFAIGWRSFNYLFLVIYPLDREQEVYNLLGPWTDEGWANLHALEIASSEITTLSGIEEFFAWFNLGTSHVQLLQYVDAAHAYDFAFQLYANLPVDDTSRPYRIMWYQTGPYWAYFYSGRYQDTINLANITLQDTISDPVLEESLYWRGLAREAIGDLEGAINDFQESVRLNPNFSPGWQQLYRLGVDG
jgi:hypothetical protein